MAWLEAGPSPSCGQYIVKSPEEKHPHEKWAKKRGLPIIRETENVGCPAKSLRNMDENLVQIMYHRIGSHS